MPTSSHITYTPFHVPGLQRHSFHQGTKSKSPASSIKAPATPGPAVQPSWLAPLAQETGTRPAAPGAEAAAQSADPCTQGSKLAPAPAPATKAKMRTGRHWSWSPSYRRPLASQCCPGTHGPDHCRILVPEQMPATAGAERSQPAVFASSDVVGMRWSRLAKPKRLSSRQESASSSSSGICQS